MAVAKWVDTTARRRASQDPGERVQRRERIVAAAAAAIEEHGLVVSTAQIAERAGLPRPHLYRVFDGKADLDAAIAGHAATALVEHVRPTLTRTGTAPQIIGAVVAAAVEWAKTHPHLYRFMAAQQQTKALHRARLGRTRFLAEVESASAAYLRARDIDLEPPAGVLAGLMGMVDATIIWWLDEQDEAEADLVQRITRQVWLVLGDLLAGVGFPVADDVVLSLPAADTVTP